MLKLTWDVGGVSGVSIPPPDEDDEDDEDDDELLDILPLDDDELLELDELLLLEELLLDEDDELDDELDVVLTPEGGADDESDAVEPPPPQATRVSASTNTQKRNGAFPVRLDISYLLNSANQYFYWRCNECMLGLFAKRHNLSMTDGKIPGQPVVLARSRSQGYADKTMLISR